MALGPLLAFVPQLYLARLDGSREYNRLADTYTRLFKQRWMEGPVDDSVLGSPDIQSLADLATGHEVTRKMRIVPFGSATIAAVAVGVLLPMLPLVLLQVPFHEVLKQLLGLMLG
jgi:hypothetical protein